MNRKSLYDRVMRWAEGKEDNPPQTEQKNQAYQAFLDYLEYLDSHEYVSFRTYQQMRRRELEEKGLAPAGSHGDSTEQTAESPRTGRRYHPGHLRRRIWIYRVLSVATAAVLTGTLAAAALRLPAFGDPNAPAVNEVPERYLEQGLEETGAVNAVTGMILDYRAFDTFGESTVLFAASLSVCLLMEHPRAGKRQAALRNEVLRRTGRLLLPAVLLFGIYVVLNGHLSPGGGFSGGTVLGCGLILASLVLGQAEMERLFSPRRLSNVTVACLAAYGVMKGYSFFTGANHMGWEIPKGTPGAIFSAGLILPLNLCVGTIVACTMYTFYRLFAEAEG